MDIFEWWNENLAIPLCPEADKKFQGLHVIGTCGEGNGMTEPLTDEGIEQIKKHTVTFQRNLRWES